MKIRRIALAVLLLLTVLFVADVRYFGGDSSTRQPSIHFGVGPSMRDQAVKKKKSFVQSQDVLTSLVIRGQQGVIDLRSTDSDQIVVHATIGADNEEILDRLEVIETVLGSEARYELPEGRSDGLQEASLSYVVEVPAGMEVSVEQHFGQVRVQSFVGFLNLDTSFSDVDVRGLDGTATIQCSFGNIDLRQIAGPITINDSFSTSKIELLAIDGGYDFDIEVTNGSLKHNAGFQMDIGENRVGASGQWGEGVHPIVIRSSFSSVTVNLDK